MKNGTIEDITIYSKELGEDMQLLVHLPHNYSPLYKYSVLIASDGKDYFQFGRIGRVIDEFIEEEEIENVITVGVPYKSVKERRRLYHPEGDRREAYTRFLAHELVPYIDANYPTYQIGSGRALIGDSLAATISLLTALKYPNIFGKVILHSPYVDDFVLEKVEAAKDPSCFSIYHVIGEGETEVNTQVDGVQDFLTPNRALHELIDKKGFLSFYEEFNGNHTWKYWQPDVRRAVQMAFGH
ncbi:esterase family protein [Sporosarcina sp. JAI121]|uniref:esterase family protein n=1 Tax=Sporosarcina sp. JAI121 TaxID=2723064 RepID=UPI0015CED3CB|nr:alpha/beta hydrolase-fold protein [Sporosarcina sp. JAI121]NYF24020.1 enterochelin esterase-like enzyme [Sporosarcina sp. JAI121]